MNELKVNYPPLRGTPEWDDREDKRMAAGNVLRSYGKIDTSNFTNGKSSLKRMR